MTIAQFPIMDSVEKQEAFLDQLGLRRAFEQYLQARKQERNTALASIERIQVGVVDEWEKGLYNSCLNTYIDRIMDSAVWQETDNCRLFYKPFLPQP